MQLDVTITGIDKNTDLRKVIELSTLYPFVEWGFLYSIDRGGKHPRYMDVNEINKITQYLPPELKLACHFCGESVEQFLSNEIDVQDFKRLQLNFSASSSSISPELIHHRATMEGENRTFIVQFNKSKANICSHLAELVYPNDNMAFLCDSSGGTGINGMSNWLTDTHLLGNFPVGYAGGISIDNIDQTLNFINLHGEPSTWIDMESSVRDERDYLDLNKVEHILEAVARKLDERTLD